MPTVKERLLRAGVRLAGLLNIIFALRINPAAMAGVCSPETRPVSCVVPSYLLRAGIGWIL